MLPQSNDQIDKAVSVWASRDNIDTAEAEVKIRDYKGYIRFKWIFIVACIIVAFLVAGYAMTIGEYQIDFFETYETIWNHITGNITEATETDDYVVWTLRFPRICTGILAGAGLAVAGAVMQSILRNPLADPYTTGISSGASFGATLALGLGLSMATGGYAVVFNAFIFALIPMVVILMVSKMRSASPTTMIMAGIAVMYIFNACTTIIKLWVDADTLSSIFTWSVGTIDGADWERVAIMAVFCILGCGALQFLARRINVMSTGDESARSIGVNADHLRIICLLLVSLLAAGIVSFTGLIGFIGLVCPHIARIVIGSDNRYLLPASAAFGAALLLVADTIGRTIIAPGVIEVGVITAFIGGPLFLYLIVKQKKEAW